tara:strand:- start:2833 stop:2997 length:165 start_codon:yes stop_codon:yes gene_type:complete
MKQDKFVAHCPAFTLKIHHLFVINPITKKSFFMTLVLLQQTAKIPALFLWLLLR